MITGIEVRNILLDQSAQNIVLVVSRDKVQADPLERTLLESLALDYEPWGTFPDLPLTTSQLWDVRTFQINTHFAYSLHMIAGVTHPHRLPAEADMPERLIDFGFGRPIDVGADDIRSAVSGSRSHMSFQLPKALDALPGWEVALIIGFDLWELDLPYEKLYLSTSRILCEAAARSEKPIRLVEHQPTRQAKAPLSKLFGFARSLPPSCHPAFG
jgi:hypothetical protein